MLRLCGSTRASEGLRPGSPRMGGARSDGCAEDGRVRDAAPTQERAGTGWEAWVLRLCGSTRASEGLRSGAPRTVVRGRGRLETGPYAGEGELWFDTGAFDRLRGSEEWTPKRGGPTGDWRRGRKRVPTRGTPTGSDGRGRKSVPTRGTPTEDGFTMNGLRGRWALREAPLREIARSRRLASGGGAL